MDRKKYIVEASDDVKKVIAVGVTRGGAIWTDTTDIENLEELNPDYINEHFGDLQDTAYQRGLDDAWWAAKKLFGYKNDGGISIEELGNVFGYGEDELYCTADIIRHNTASEAIAKLKAYEEQKADDEIKVGDEVEWDNEFGDRFVVTRIYQPYGQKEQCDGIDDDGDVCRAVLIENLVKTGRHFDIDKILEEMRT